MQARIFWRHGDGQRDLAGLGQITGRAAPAARRALAGPRWVGWRVHGSYAIVCSTCLTGSQGP